MTATILNTWAFTKSSPFTGASTQATATDAEGNTSEFSEPMAFMAQRIYLPLVTKGYDG